MSYDPSRHHRRSIRLKGHDYTQAGAYFVNLCTWQRECLFGEVVDGEMVLSRFGQVAAQKWEDIPRHFSHVALDEWVVMPNHIHGIIWIINESADEADDPTPCGGEAADTQPGEAFATNAGAGGAAAADHLQQPADPITANASPLRTTVAIPAPCRGEAFPSTLRRALEGTPTQPHPPPDQVAGNASPGAIPAAMASTPVDDPTQPHPLPDQVAGNTSPGATTVAIPAPCRGEAFPSTLRRALEGTPTQPYPSPDHVTGNASPGIAGPAADTQPHPPPDQGAANASPGIAGPTGDHRPGEAFATNAGAGGAATADHPQRPADPITANASPLQNPTATDTDTDDWPCGAPPGSLGAIVGNFKSVVTRRINRIRRTPGGRLWQRGYWEHIGRNEQELAAIRRYIQENPARWAEDEENPQRRSPKEG